MRGMAVGESGEAITEFEGAEFGDQRLSKRLAALAGAVSRDPSGSLPRVLSGAELEAAYRFLGNVKVDPDAILAPHIHQTRGRIANQELVLVAHDSSTVSYNSEGEREGLTPARGTKQSFMVHCSLAIRADGSRCAEGIVAASYHIPTDAEAGSLQKRWGEQVLKLHSLGIAPSKVIHLMDREADDYELLDLLTGIGGRFVIRVQHNRSTEEGRLRSILGSAVIHAEREIPLSKRGGKVGPKQKRIHPPRKTRLAKVAIAATSVTIQRTTTSAGAARKELTLQLVHVWEASPPAGEPGVEWLLYTTEPVDTAEQVLQVVDWYRTRWTIEEYFKALKSGCALEKRQFGDFYTLTNTTALFLPIAWKVLLMKSESREHPDEPAELVLDGDELTVLRIKAEKPLPESPTVSDVTRAVARLGGHLKHNGPPGWQTLARGYERLSGLVEGWKLHRDFEAGRSCNAVDSPSVLASEEL